MIYFDNAATTFPKPREVIMAASKGISYYGGNPGRSGHSISIRAAQKVFEVRQEIADFFGAEVENVIFTSNCTHALNIAIKGVMAKGGHIISTNLEHNSVLRPIVALSKKPDVSYSIVNVLKKDDDELLRALDEAIRPETKLIVCTHGSNVTGDILPIEAIARLCKARKIICAVDAAQTAGVLPINIEESGIDLLCTAGHKGLYGPTGTGLLILGKNVMLDTIIEGGTGSDSFNTEQPDFYPDRLEAGTVNTTGICGLGAGVKFLKGYGVDKAYSHEMELVQIAFNHLSNMDNIILYDETFELDKKLPVLLFNIMGKTSMETVEALDKAGFALRGGVHCSPLVHQGLGTNESGAVRLSVSIFNTKQEIQSIVRKIKQIAV